MHYEMDWGIANSIDILSHVRLVMLFLVYVCSSVYMSALDNDLNFGDYDLVRNWLWFLVEIQM